MKKSMLPPPHVETLEEAKETIRFLWEKVTELEDKLNQNSRNSSVPPSKDRVDQITNTSSLIRGSSGKKLGVQQGHKGHRRERHPHDERLLVERHSPKSHCHCGGLVIRNTHPYAVHPIFDLPETAYTVLEHQVYQGQSCQCSEKWEPIKRGNNESIFSPPHTNSQAIEFKGKLRLFGRGAIKSICYPRCL